MVASVCASLEWLDAAVTSVPLAIMALARQVVKVFVCLLVSPLSFPASRLPLPLLCFFLHQLHLESYTF